MAYITYNFKCEWIASIVGINNKIESNVQYKSSCNDRVVQLWAGQSHNPADQYQSRR